MRARGGWIVVGALAAAAAGWWLFGCTIDQDAGRTIIVRRVFGRVTRIHMFVGGVERERFLFPWSEPFQQGDVTEMDSCEAIFPEHWVDLNDDGRWDTWYRRVGPDDKGQCALEYHVDTDLDGRPDWQFVLRGSEYAKGAAMMKARRGF